MLASCKSLPNQEFAGLTAQEKLLAGFFLLPKYYKIRSEGPVHSNPLSDSSRGDVLPDLPRQGRREGYGPQVRDKAAIEVGEDGWPA